MMELPYTNMFALGGSLLGTLFLFYYDVDVDVDGSCTNVFFR